MSERSLTSLKEQTTQRLRSIEQVLRGRFWSLTLSGLLAGGCVSIDVKNPFDPSPTITPTSIPVPTIILKPTEIPTPTATIRIIQTETSTVTPTISGTPKVESPTATPIVTSTQTARVSVTPQRGVEIPTAIQTPKATETPAATSTARPERNELFTKPWIGEIKNWLPFSNEVSGLEGQAPWAIGGPLDKYDKAFGTKTREAAEKFAKEQLRKYPNAKRWIGWCSAQMYWVAQGGQEPVISGGKRFNGIEFTKEDLIVLNSLLHAGDGADKFEPTPRNLDQMKQLISKGRWVVVDAPERKGEEWYRIAYEVSADGKQVKVTNYGHGDKWIPISAINNILYSVPSDGSRKIFPEEQALLDDKKPWRNSGLETKNVKQLELSMR